MESTPLKLYGICNTLQEPFDALASFQMLIEDYSEGIKDNFLIQYLNDFIIYSSACDDHQYYLD